MNKNREVVRLAKKQNKKEEKVDNQNPSCPNCDTKKKMSVRQVDTDRDGRIIADIWACSECHAWIRILRQESKEDEIARLKKRLVALE